MGGRARLDRPDDELLLRVGGEHQRVPIEDEFAGDGVVEA